jgi:hypothetical protein
MLTVAAGVTDYFIQNAGYFAAVVIVAVGLLYGLRDIARFSPVRALAISGVSFVESIRRRVLWVTPVAIVGILAVAQFLDPVDPQDALRQTTKVCLFATGLVVVITAIILACTNLPKEIESRVIYTIVTKPTTRLEIVLGKVLGFAWVSLAILLIMGLFSWGYLSLREWRTRSWIRQQLAADHVDVALRPTFQVYADNGLLVTKSMADPVSAHVMARPPEPGRPAVLAGGESQYFSVPFELTAEQKEDVRNAVKAGGGAFVLLTVGYEQRIPTAEEAKTIRDLRLPTAAAGGDTSMSQGSLLPSLPTLAAVQLPIPQMTVHLYNKDLSKLVDDKLVNEGKPVQLPPGGNRPKAAPAVIAPEALEQMLAADRFFVMVDANTVTVNYLISEVPAVLAYASGPDAQPQAILPAPDPSDPQRPTPPSLESHRGRFGMQMRGRSDGSGVVAAYPFSGVKVPAGGADDLVTFEANIGIESSPEYDKEGNVTPVMSFQVRNRGTGETSEPMRIRVESHRAVPVTVPARLLAGGEFDVYLRGLNDGVWYGVEKRSISLVRSAQPFSLNLGKGLLVLWLMSILVVAIAVFCSTFLSWPIAIVLTLFILLGHWGVSQLGDIASAGLGTEVTQAMGLEDPTAARIVRGSVGFLTNLLGFIAQFLPDISKFPATEDIERGISMPPDKLAGAAWVLLGYGVPVTLLGYVILRNKEVAP